MISASPGPEGGYTLRQYTILRDTREKKPLLFPEWLPCAGPPNSAGYPVPFSCRLLVRDSRLETGDYALAEGSSCLVERKGSIREVAGNCFSADRPRFLTALDRLAAAAPLPVLVLEGSPADLLRPSPSLSQPPSVCLSSLVHELASRRISLILLPSSTPLHRRALGEVVAHLLLSGALPDG